MNTDQIIETAIQGHASTRDAIRWAMKQEREECLKICLDYNKFYWMATHGGLKCAELIKERNDECLTAPLTKTRRSGESSRLGQNKKNGL